MVATPRCPTSTPVYFPGLDAPATLGDFGFILYRNGLVLALHGFACVAGFMAGSSLPQVAEGYSGSWRWVHDKAGPLAIAFVVCATLFSLTTQAYALGSAAATSPRSSACPPALLLIGAARCTRVPELFALFLPLAAWTSPAAAALERAAGGDVRDRRDRDPDRHRGRRRRDLGDAGLLRWLAG